MNTQNIKVEKSLLEKKQPKKEKSFGDDSIPNPSNKKETNERSQAQQRKEVGIYV